MEVSLGIYLWQRGLLSVFQSRRMGPHIPVRSLQSLSTISWWIPPTLLNYRQCHVRMDGSMITPPSSLRWPQRWLAVLFKHKASNNLRCICSQSFHAFKEEGFLVFKDQNCPFSLFVPTSGTWYAIKEGKTKQLPPSSLLEWCLEPFPSGVLVTGTSAWLLYSICQIFLTLIIQRLKIRSGHALTLYRFGRKIMLLVSYVSGMVFALASAFSTTYLMFVILRFFTGFCITGIVIISTVLSNYIFEFMFKLSAFFLSCKLYNWWGFCFLQAWSGWTLSTGNWWEWLTACHGRLEM